MNSTLINPNKQNSTRAQPSESAYIYETKLQKKTMSKCLRDSTIVSKMANKSTANTELIYLPPTLATTTSI